MFYQLSAEFQWTPEQIRRLTLQEFEHYIIANNRYRENIHPTDCSLEAIRVMLAQYFGVKEMQKPADVETKIQKVATAKLTKEEKDAWLAAGMPSPFDGWLHHYRKEQARGRR